MDLQGSSVEQARARHRRQAAAALPAAAGHHAGPQLPDHATKTTASVPIRGHTTATSTTATTKAAASNSKTTASASKTTVSSASHTTSTSTSAKAANTANAAAVVHSSTSTAPSTKTKAGSNAKTTSSKAIGPSSTPIERAASKTNATVGAVVGVAVVLALVVTAFFLRRWFIKRRLAKGSAWRASLHNMENKRNTYTDSARSQPGVLRPLLTEKPLAPLPADALQTPSSPSPFFAVARPSSVYSVAPSSSAASGWHGLPLAPQSAALSTMNAAVASTQPSTPPPSSLVRGEQCIVKRAFVPTLPDELSVTAGETIFIVVAYDDGWAKCVNVHNDHGVVPLECLSRVGDGEHNHVGGGTQGQDRESWRVSKRASSLYAPSNGHGTY